MCLFFCSSCTVKLSPEQSYTRLRLNMEHGGECLQLKVTATHLLNWCKRFACAACCTCECRRSGIIGANVVRAHARCALEGGHSGHYCSYSSFSFSMQLLFSQKGFTYDFDPFPFPPKNKRITRPKK